MSKAIKRSLTAALAAGLIASFGAPALADHKDPRQPIVPLQPGFPGQPALTQGEGEFSFIRNFPAPLGAALSGSGSDHKYFRFGEDLFVSTGTLGQGDVGNVGQRFFQLEDENGVNPRWVADHGSAACTIANTSVTGLQHDAALLGQASPADLRRGASVPSRSMVVEPEIIVDTTDAAGRCHDPNGGGLEFIDVTGIQDPAFKPREIHLIRHAGFSHTVTTDDRRPWILYNNSSDFSGRPWIDVIDARSCLGLAGRSLDAKRNACRPQVYRIPFEPDWSRQVNSSGGTVPGSEAACHDITSRDSRIYCAGLNATLIFDVSGLTTARGGIRGEPLPCARINGTRTGASVTDCGGVEGPTAANSVPEARGWKFLGTVNHPGRNCVAPVTNCNTNMVVPSDEGVAVSHEADPTPDHKWMFVTDERGGGVVPPGASCAPGIDNPVGNGGIHVFDIRDPSNIKYAQTPDGEKAVWISDAQVPAATFCDVHVIEQIPGEQRLAVAYYSQGTKILDYFIDEQGRWTFRETASIIFPNANTWASDVFKIVDNGDGTRTYHFLATDIGRGVDVFTWTGPTNPMGTPPPADALSASGLEGNVGLLALGLGGMPLAARFGRRRRRS
ncbi:MAG TPA: hypothetical protein VG602_07840 [Actinomycetota bacterium]|nr:hypothetical protein [Actinomycetota bacterium]